MDSHTKICVLTTWYRYISVHRHQYWVYVTGDLHGLDFVCRI